MRTRTRLLWRDLKLGLVIIIASVLLGVGIVAVGGSGSGFWIPKVTYFTDLPQASGLYVGSLVMIDGVEVGTVRAIRLNPSGHGVRVEFKVARRLRNRIRADSVVSVENLGLLGDRYLNIRSGSTDRPEVAPGSVLPGEPSGDYSAALKQLSQSIPEIRRTLTNLAEITERMKRGEGLVGALLVDTELTEQVKQVVRNLNEGRGSLGLLLNDQQLYRGLTDIVTTLNRKDGLLQAVLADPESARKLQESITGIHDFVARLQNGSGTLGKLVSDEGLYREINDLAHESAALLKKIQSPETSLGLLLSDRELYDQIRSSVQDVRDLIGEIRKHPKRYLSVKVALIAF